MCSKLPSVPCQVWLTYYPPSHQMTSQEKCYLCGSKDYNYRSGSVRDNPALKICECVNCGLVYLSSFDHADVDFYEDSGMHGEQLLDIKNWLASTEADDERRFLYLKPLLAGKSVLDFGCGAGGFLLKAKSTTAKVYGVELERRLQDHFSKHGLTVFENIESLPEESYKSKFDFITMFHVLEHIQDPKDMLKKLSTLLSDNGELIVEVPHADDALLTLYNSEPFSNFTYWSCHLFLFTIKTLEMLVRQSGLKINYIKQIQRYSLANHLYWLSQGKPGGHQHWHFLDSHQMHETYEKHLAAIGKCDTLLMSLSR